MAITDAPKIITGRFGYDDSHTLDALRRHRRLPGAAQGRSRWRPTPSATRSRPPACSAAAAPASPPASSGAPAPADVWPRYLVVNGDESEPGTYKDRILMERDPHQLIEGVLIACYAIGAGQAFLYVRGEMALAQERIAAGAQRGLRRRLRRQATSSAPTSRSTSCSRGAPAPTSCGEETALIESLEGNRGMPRLKPPFFPAAKGLYMQPTIVNNVETLSNLPWIIDQRRRRPSPPSAPRTPAARACSPCRATSGTPGVFEVEYGVTTFRDLIYAARLRRRHPRRQRSSRRSSPVAVGPVVLRGAPRPAAREGAPSTRAGSMLGSGAIVVMDETTDAVKAAPGARAVLRPRVLRQVHAVPRGHHLARADPQPHPRRPRPPERPRPAAGRLRQHLARAAPGRPSRPPSARSARRPPRRSPRPSAASATSSRPASPRPRKPARSVPVELKAPAHA